ECQPECVFAPLDIPDCIIKLIRNVFRWGIASAVSVTNHVPAKPEIAATRGRVSGKCESHKTLRTMVIIEEGRLHETSRDSLVPAPKRLSSPKILRSEEHTSE